MTNTVINSAVQKSTNDRTKSLSLMIEIKLDAEKNYIIYCWTPTLYVENPIETAVKSHKSYNKDGSKLLQGQKNDQLGNLTSIPHSQRTNTLPSQSCSERRKGLRAVTLRVDISVK
jgi:hypothetical protein